MSEGCRLRRSFQHSCVEPAYIAGRCAPNFSRNEAERSQRLVACDPSPVRFSPPGCVRSFAARSLLFRGSNGPECKVLPCRSLQRPDFARNLDSELGRRGARRPCIAGADRKGGRNHGFWRVAAIAPTANTGDYSPAKVLKFRAPARLSVPLSTDQTVGTTSRRVAVGPSRRA